MITCKNIRKTYPLGRRDKQALRGIDFQIGKGERVGFLGRNGAGKSTLIRLIGGVELPTAGQIERRMSVSWPLAFSGGFQGSLTGYDNARFIARIYGREYREIRDFVEDFAELGHYMKMPVKTYSSGMKARLAFGLSLAIDFDCYLIDEVIAVGDHRFQEKCRRELFEKRADRALILASHSAGLVREYCERAMILADGYGVMHDQLDSALEAYDRL
jgi:capsular polysaccharide transport system ATP-binding protein